MRSAAVNGTKLAYVDEGPREGTPIVFSHSLFFDHSMFDSHRERFVREGFRVIAYDHRNQGGSAPAPRGEVDMDTLTEDAAALIQHLGLGKCHFVGNSMGGFISLRLAARRPDLLLSATALGSSAEQEHKLEEFGSLVDHLTDHGPEQVVDTLMYIMFGDTSLANKPELCARWREFMSRLSPRIGDSAYGVIHRSRIIEELSGCGVRVLAIAGSEDHAYPQPISGEHIAAASGGTHVTVDGAGHSVALEQSDIVAEHLKRLFAETTA
ncbi:alpha/beta hydrolase [Streptomyces hygroscopicus]|uniref:alpha/beta fold hydrolase n=1 Tax=Streptomyces hygroscopicus TaxID=1912 RepID=UPI002240DF24|nr:alpha/beta hydrolase [Streptomyces hygroscopicus]MCW7944290.1 alpha/beta hydrolase [Streptomyces hygroscopicus]